MFNMSTPVKIPQVKVNTGLIQDQISNINLPGANLETKSTSTSSETTYTEEEQSLRDLKYQNLINATEESIEGIDADILKLETALGNVTEVTEENAGYYNQLTSQVAQLKNNKLNYQLFVMNAQNGVTKRDADGNPILDENGEEEEESLFTLERAEKYLMLAGLGMILFEDFDALLGGDDVSPIDIEAELNKATNAVTDAGRMDKIITASYRDQPRLNDLENLGNYRNQFGAISSEYFNSDFGPELESAYAQMVAENPNLSRDQFLVEFARANPTNPISQDINYRLSRMGQLERSTNTIAGIDRNLIRTGLDDASKFYQPKSEGGYGFNPTDFRTNDQQRLVDQAMATDDDMSLLQESIGRRVRNQGKLETDEVRDITSRALTSVDPSLSGQAYIRNGGINRAVLNNSNAQLSRLTQAEGSLGSLIGLRQGSLATANNVVNTNTLDPVKAFGLTGSNTSLANQIYTTNPTTGQNYDPTGDYFSSITGINSNIAQANAMNSKGRNLTGMADTIGQIDDTLKS